jgi:hypothetical protein
MSRLLCRKRGSIRPAPHLLGTNHPPSPSVVEARSIRQTVAGARSAQARLAREIARLQATNDALCNEKDTVDKYIREHEVLGIRKMWSPIGRYGVV